MRIIRVKVKKDTKRLLNEVSRQFGIDDPGYCEDLYSLLTLKGQGIPTKPRIASMAKYAAKHQRKPRSATPQPGMPTKTTVVMSELTVRILMSKRAQTLKALTQLPYFYALQATQSPVSATRSLITQFKKLYHKMREVQCLSCSFHAQCDFGKQYEASVRDIRAVVDPNYQKKVHASCPNLPEITMSNMLAAAANQMNAVGSNPQATQLAQQIKKRYGQASQGAPPASLSSMNEWMSLLNSGLDPEMDDEVYDPEDDDEFTMGLKGGYSKSVVFDAKFTGAHVVKTIESFIDQVSQQQLAIFEISRELDVALDVGVQKKMKSVEHVDKDTKPRAIKGIQEESKVDPRSHGLPQEVFDAKLDKKQLNAKQHQEPEKKTQLLHCIIDNSGSMASLIGSAENGLLTRGALASSLSIALAKRMVREKGILFARFFTGSCSQLISCRKAGEFDALASQIALANYNGGGTNIIDAIETARKDIESAKDDLGKAEILLITDCDDEFDPTRALTALGQKVKLNVLDVSGSTGGNRYSAHASLQKIATKFFRANQSSLNVKDLIETVV